MKKQLVVVSALTSVMTIALTLVIGRANKIDLVSGLGENHSHEIYLYGDNVTPDAYDEDLYIQTFALEKNNAIIVSPSEKYPIASYDYDDGFGTYYYSEYDECIDWNVPQEDTSKPNYIASMIANWNYLVFVFKFDLRVNFNTNNSLVYVSGDNVSASGAHCFELYGSDEEYNYYWVMVDGYSDYGSTINIEYAKLVFSC